MSRIYEKALLLIFVAGLATLLHIFMPLIAVLETALLTLVILLTVWSMIKFIRTG